MSLNHGVIGSLETYLFWLKFPKFQYGCCTCRVMTFHDIEFQHHSAWYFGCPHAGNLLSGSSNKPFTAIAHRFFVRLTPLNNIPVEISNEKYQLDNRF